MKKVKAISIITIVILSSVILGIYFLEPKPIAETTSAATVNADLSFAVFGDIHENVESFQEAINDFHTINPGMDALVLNGDTVDQGIQEQYDSIKKVLSKNKDLLPKTIIKNIGNHEFFDYGVEVNSPQQVQSFIDRYLEFSGEEKVYHDTWVNDYHFISLGSEDGNSETLNSITASISKNQQSWLKDKLAEKYQKGKPIFVFLHQHLNSGNTGWVGVQESEQVRQILSQYPEVILFTSHTHRELDEISIVVNQPFTMVHTGAIHYTIIPDPNSENGRRNEPYIKAVYIEVNGNSVIIKGRNVKSKQWIFTEEL